MIFRFKQFSVRQDRTAMKVGTDGVLLGAWCNIDNDSRILDIGTGTGVISLIAAQRSEAIIDGIEIEEDAYKQTVENFNASPWSSRLNAFHTPLLHFTTSDREGYNHIISNPPYFRQSLLSPNRARNIARHDQSLPFDQLISCSYRLLAQDGKLSLIVPFQEVNAIHSLAQASGLMRHRITKVITKPEIPPKRALIEYRKTQQSVIAIENELIIELSEDIYSPEYIKLTQMFYLKM